MDVKLDDDSMRAIISKAVLDSLTPERREQLIGEAVKQLLERGRESGVYSDNRSKLQKAFDEAVYAVTAQVAREELAKEETLQAKVRQLMLDAWERLATGEAYEKLVSNVADGMRKAISGDRY